MRYLLWALLATSVAALERHAAAAELQSESAQQEPFDMEAAEDRYVKIGSRFGLLLIIAIAIKMSLDKRKSGRKAAAAPPTRRPPARR